MNDIPYSKLTLSLLVIVGWALIGISLRWLGLLKPSWDKALLRCVVWFLYPCLILQNVMKNSTLESNPSLLFTILLCGFFAIATGQIVARIAASQISFMSSRERNTFVFTTGIFNYGYFAFPVANALFGPETFGILLVFVAGVELGIWSIGILFLTAGSEKLEWKRMVNPPMIAVALALALNWSGYAEQIPQGTDRLIDRAASLAIPIGLILIGATLGDNLRGLNLHKHYRVVLTACTLRQLVLPLGFIAAAARLPIMPELKAVLVIEAAMPCGIFPIVIAKHYGGSTNTALQIILGSTFLSVLTIPLWVVVGVDIVNLKDMLNSH